MRRKLLKKVAIPRLKLLPAKTMTRRVVLPGAVALAAAITLSGCGAWWGSTSVGSDLYLGDYYPSYNPIYYPDYSPGYYPGGWYPNNGITPPPPPPSSGPVIVVPGNGAGNQRPGGNPGGINGPGANPGGINGPGINQGGNNGPGEGGFRPTQNNPGNSFGQGGFRPNQSGSSIPQGGGGFRPQGGGVSSRH